MRDRKPRILAIDDTPENLLTLGAALADEFDLQVATSGAGGLAVAGESPPDLILLDVMMPGMDGFETCRRLKADSRLQMVPVVFLTALGGIDAEAKGLALGAADYIAKPINVEIARHRIRNLIERERLRKEVEAQRAQLEARLAERELAEAALRKSQERLAEAQRIARIGNWELNLLDNTLIWSDEIFRIFEIDKMRFGASYDAFLAVIHPEDRGVVDAAYRRSLENREPYEISHRLLMPDGRIKHVHEQGMSFYDPEGRPFRSAGTVQDITERKLIEDAWRDNERKMRMLLDNAADAVFVANAEERWVYINDRAIELLGYDSEELLGTSIYDIVPPSYRDPYRREFHQMRAEGRIWIRELRLIRKDGSRVPVEMNAVKLPDGGIYGSCRDITERKLVEENQRIAATAFETREGIIVTDSKGAILRVNHAFTKLTGYGAEEAVGKTPALLRSGRHDDAFYRQMWEALRKNKYWEGEVWNRRKNGEIYPEWLTITAVVRPDGKTTHYVAVFSDITERKATEEQIHQLAFYDPLTNLPNRRLLLDRCSQALRACSRRKNRGAVLFLDLDRFKVLNDTKGHDVGDLLLIEVAHRLLSCVRAEDTVGRMGGDEFVVVLDELGPEAPLAAERAKGVAEKIRAALDEPYSLDGHIHSSSPSIGVCLFDGTEESVNEVLMRADKAMYQAKAAGRNTVRVFAGPES